MRERMMQSGTWVIDGFKVRKTGRKWVVFDFLSSTPIHSAKTLRECRRWLIDRSGECS